MQDGTNETDRIAAVQRYDVLDTPPDGAFDRITALAARLFDVPISIVSIVDNDRIWFKSHHGIDVDEIGREPGLCASAIGHHEPWLVNDAARDPRTMTNPLVAGELGLRFYAGVPLTTSDGYNLGTLNVIDVEPRELTESEVATLQDLAAVVVDELELRLAVRGIRDERQRQALEIHDTIIQGLSVVSLALQAGNHEKAREATATSLGVASDMVTRLRAEAERREPFQPGDLIREAGPPF